MEDRERFHNTAGALAALTDDAPPAPEEWRIVTVIWGGNVLRGSLVSLDLPEIDTMSLTLEDLDFSRTAFSAIPEGDSP